MANLTHEDKASQVYKREIQQMRLGYPIELKIRRDAMMVHVSYLIRMVEIDPLLQLDLDVAIRLLNDLNTQVEDAKQATRDNLKKS